MSHTIVQSFKAYRLTDGKNELYILGSVAEDNNVSPRRYDRIYLNNAFESKDEFKAYIASLADSTLGGSIQLKDKYSSSSTHQARTLATRLVTNIERAKTIEIESIKPDAQDPAKMEVKWGDGGHQLSDKEGTFQVMFKENFKLTKSENLVEDLKAVELLTKATITNEDVLAHIENQPMFGRFLDDKQSLNQDQILHYYKHATCYGAPTPSGQVTDPVKVYDLLTMSTKHHIKTRLDNVKGDISDDLARRVVKANPEFLSHCKPNLKDDKELVISVFGKPHHKYLLAKVSDRLKADKEVVLAAVKQNGLSLEHASKELRADKEVILAAAKEDGRALEYASEEPRADKEIILVAVMQNGRALEYASEELRADKEIVLAACKQDNWAAKNAHPSIKDLFKDKDPVQTLEAAIRMEKMQEQLKPKAPSQTRTMKI